MIIDIHAKIKKITNKTFNADYPKYSLLVALDDWSTKLSITTEKDIFKVGDEVKGEIDLCAISGISKNNGTYYEINECRDLDLKVLKSNNVQNTYVSSTATMGMDASSSPDDEIPFV